MATASAPGGPRVVQWSTGNVGRQSVRAVLAHPDLRLVGRSVVELRTVWRKGQTLEPDWPIDTGHRIIVDGCPKVSLRRDIAPPPDFRGTTMSDFMRLPMILTAMPAVTPSPR